MKSVNSANTVSLASKVTVNLISGQISADLSPTIWVGDGANNVQKATVRILDRSGIELATQEIFPPMTAVVTADLPTIDSVYKWGNITVETTLIDGDKTYVDYNTHGITAPVEASSITGLIPVTLKARCSQGRTLVVAGTPPPYQGKQFTTYEQDAQYYYPHTSGEPSIAAAFTPFYAKLIEGRNECHVATTATYEVAANFFVVVKFIGTADKNIVCVPDLCQAYVSLHHLIEKASQCLDERELEALQSKIDQALKLVTMINLGDDCSSDTGVWVAELEDLLQIDLSCPGLPPLTFEGIPAETIIIEGCNTNKTEAGLTTKYKIDNYAYELKLTNQRGAISQTNTTNACTKTFTLNFDWATIADLMLEQFEGSKNARFLQIFNTALNAVDPKCVTTAKDWRDANLVGKFTALIAKMCACCADATVPGEMNIVPDCEAIVVAGSFEIGTAVTGSVTIHINSTGEPGNVTASLSGTGVTGSLGSTAVVAGDNTLVIPLVFSGSGSAGYRNVTVNIVYANKNATCVVPINVTAQPGCSAPGTPTVTKAADTITIAFAPAAQEPPSYSIKRRLASDTDVDANYITLAGLPTFDAALGKYKITEQWTNAELDKIWIYKVISICTGGGRPFSTKEFISQTCPVVTLNSTESGITYSFPHVGGQTNQYRVALYQGIILIGSIQTKAISPSPVTGSFSGLTANTAYTVKVYNEITGTSYSKECANSISTQNVSARTLNWSIDRTSASAGAIGDLLISVNGSQVVNSPVGSLQYGAITVPIGATVTVTLDDTLSESDDFYLKVQDSSSTYYEQTTQIILPLPNPPLTQNYSFTMPNDNIVVTSRVSASFS